MSAIFLPSICSLGDSTTAPFQCYTSLRKRKFGKNLFLLSRRTDKFSGFSYDPCLEIKTNVSTRASVKDDEYLPDSLLEDPKFVPITETDPSFGPAVMLLLGFDQNGVSEVQNMLRDIDGEFLKVAVCTEKMLRGTLGEAIQAASMQSAPIAVKPWTRTNSDRICFLSGLTGEETVMMIDAWQEAGLKNTVFAAMVPNNKDKEMQDLIPEIMGDHIRLMQQ